MRNKFSIHLALVLITLFTNCTKEPGAIKKSNEKDLLAFKIEAALNKNVLKEDISGIISQDTITLHISKSLEKSHLIATFSTSGQSVFIGNIEQRPGITVNDFSKKISYTVKAEVGSEKEYALLVKEKIPDWKSGVPHIFIETENKALLFQRMTT